MSWWWCHLFFKDVCCHCFRDFPDSTVFIGCGETVKESGLLSEDCWFESPLWQECDVLRKPPPKKNSPVTGRLQSAADCSWLSGVLDGIESRFSLIRINRVVKKHVAAVTHWFSNYSTSLCQNMSDGSLKHGGRIDCKCASSASFFFFFPPPKSLRFTRLSN